MRRWNTKNFVHKKELERVLRCQEDLREELGKVWKDQEKNQKELTEEVKYQQSETRKIVQDISNELKVLSEKIGNEELTVRVNLERLETMIKALLVNSLLDEVERK